ncbi:RUS family member 1-like isoform X2 [Homarus americanus]|uniref:RUS family member 1-like isoform X2 n=1 Tax=Homarus americanus TaxID=6706 RepID=UPI001C45BDCD|nr:RUS family member 1-like isoform X2 [Homarus americanus]
MKSLMKTNDGALLYQERKGSTACQKTYVYQKSAKTFIPVTVDEKGRNTVSIKDHIGEWLKDVFLPRGYPESVSPDYLQYQMWDTIQAYCSSIAGALSLQATLTGLGVGEEAATPLAATLTWLLKDGSGMVASIAFAHWRGSQLDCNSKQWRLFADVANDLGHLLKLLGPLLPVPFLAVMCVSAVMMALVGVAGGGTRAALTSHQARRDNMADVSAKDGSQETVVNLIALFTSLTILPIITSSFMLTWMTFVLCVVFHLLANYWAVRAVKMESLNRPRLLYVLHHWFTGAAVPGIEETNLSEPLLFGAAFIPNYFPYGFRTMLGCSFHWALECCRSNEDVMTLYSSTMDTFTQENYLLCTSLKRRQIYIIYRPGITAQEELEAVFMAYLYVLNSNHISEGSQLSAEYVAEGLSTTAPDMEVLTIVKRHAQKIFPTFLQNLQEKGWLPDKLHMAAAEWRLL